MTPRVQTSLFAATDSRVYCADSSAFIDLDRRSHPQDLNPKLWAKIAELVDNGRIIAPREVLRELAHEDDQLFHWVKARSHMIIAPDEAQQEALQEIMKQFPYCIKSGVTGPFADPWVVALAKTRSACVLTFETPSGNSKGAKIPDICAAFEIKYTTPWQMMRDEGWRF